MAAQGRCLQMCPVYEMEMREREKLLHPLEMLDGYERQKYPRADPYKVVKCFSRSAAGNDLASPDILRPTPVLIKTVTYLLTHVLSNSRFSPICKYDFIVDRLRAVQQDMVIQALPPDECIQILEPIVKFHCLYGYRLCTEDISHYDPVLNRRHLLEYLKRLLVCYDQVSMHNSNIDDCMQRLQISNNSQIENRRLIEAIYVMCNLGDVHPIERYLKLPKIYKTGYLKTCFEISLNYMTRNWVRICNLMKKIPPLPLCGGILYLPDIRKTAYGVMSQAYNTKVLKYPIENLSRILLYEDDKDLIKECHQYSLQIVDQSICFNKDNFQNNKVFPLKKLKFLDGLINDEDLVS